MSSNHSFSKMGFIRFIRSTFGWHLRDSKRLADSVYTDIMQKPQLHGNLATILSERLHISRRMALLILRGFHNEHSPDLDHFRALMQTPNGRTLPEPFEEYLPAAHAGCIAAARGTKSPREVAQEAISHAKAMAEALRDLDDGRG